MIKEYEARCGTGLDGVAGSAKYGDGIAGRQS